MFRNSVLVVCGLIVAAGCSSSSEADTSAKSSSHEATDKPAANDAGGEQLTGEMNGEVDSDRGANGGSGLGSLLDAGASTTGPIPFDPMNLPGGGFISIATNDAGTFEVLCGSAPCACSDGKDNDGDGVVDGMDDECTGPFDNDESTFATGIPGDNQDPKWQDCFFDGNSGAGDDGCRYHTDCITGKVDPADDQKKCGISEQCVNFCAPRTPPGCDCFGCCGVTVAGETINILVGESCSTENIEDEKACPRCVPTAACQNECGECEICVGKGIEDLPAKCFTAPPATGTGGSGSTPPPTGAGGAGSTTPPTGGGATTTPPTGTGGSGSTPPAPPNLCDSGAKACSVSADCGGSAYCSLGCCKFSMAK